LAKGVERSLTLCERNDVRHACRDHVANYTIERAAAGIAEAYHAACAARDSAA
jgi:hypothetical protein